eukprot:TRINITY_DN27449_c0_g1_i1.p1 TRINITY_DN27449_c0_g1~~TRINITY_DN27449_c0_g1_i1.p1  ORF type:complete len:765 (-),score=166.05 TRINITY_DN27449_c0_g1_i1:32-2326(-)
MHYDDDDLSGETAPLLLGSKPGATAKNAPRIPAVVCVLCGCVVLLLVGNSSTQAGSLLQAILGAAGTGPILSCFYDEKQKVAAPGNHQEPSIYFTETDWENLRTSPPPAVKGAKGVVQPWDQQARLEVIRRLWHTVPPFFERVLPHVRWWVSSGGLIGALRLGATVPWDLDGDLVLDMASFRAAATDVNLRLHAKLWSGNASSKFIAPLHGAPCVAAGGCLMLPLSGFGDDAEDFYFVSPAHAGDWHVGRFVDMRTGFFIEVLSFRYDAGAVYPLQQCMLDGVTVNIPREPVRFMRSERPMVGPAGDFNTAPTGQSALLYLNKWNRCSICLGVQPRSDVTDTTAQSNPLFMPGGRFGGGGGWAHVRDPHLQGQNCVPLDAEGLREGKVPVLATCEGGSQQAGGLIVGSLRSLLPALVKVLLLLVVVAVVAMTSAGRGSGLPQKLRTLWPLAIYIALSLAFDVLSLLPNGQPGHADPKRLPAASVRVAAVLLVSSLASLSGWLFEDPDGRRSLSAICQQPSAVLLPYGMLSALFVVGELLHQYLLQFPAAPVQCCLGLRLLMVALLWERSFAGQHLPALAWVAFVAIAAGGVGRELASLKPSLEVLLPLGYPQALLAWMAAGAVVTVSYEWLLMRHTSQGLAIDAQNLLLCTSGLGWLAVGSLAAKGSEAPIFSTEEWTLVFADAQLLVLLLVSAALTLWTSRVLMRFSSVAKEVAVAWEVLLMPANLAIMDAKDAVGMASLGFIVLGLAMCSIPTVWSALLRPK